MMRAPLALLVAATGGRMAEWAPVIILYHSAGKITKRGMNVPDPVCDLALSQQHAIRSLTRPQAGALQS